MSAHILVIEDEADVFDLLRAVLEPDGFGVTRISHPAEAETLMPDQAPDLILMDLMLPALDGVKLAGQLRANGFAHTPIIALSASKIMLHFACESGLFEECLEKPFDVTDLRECVRRYVGVYVTAHFVASGVTGRAQERLG